MSALVSTLKVLLGSRASSKEALRGSSSFSPREAGPLAPSRAPVTPPQPTPREVLYTTAQDCLGSALTLPGEVPDHVACVASLQAVIFRATGAHLGKVAPPLNTSALRHGLDADARFKKIVFDELKPGDMVVAVTGEARDRWEVGHCWIAGSTHWMSNTSANGLWRYSHARAEVLLDFEKRHGFPLHCYRLTTTEPQ